MLQNICLNPKPKTNKKENNWLFLFKYCHKGLTGPFDFFMQITVLDPAEALQNLSVRINNLNNIFWFDFTIISASNSDIKYVEGDS